MKEYVEYANDFHRHADEKGQATPLRPRREGKAIICLTGLVIRLALSKES
jgi:hypothetical protein